MARAAEIAALRALGLSLAQVARVLGGNPQDLEPALAAHQERLEEQVRQTSGAIEKIRKLRADLAQGHAPTAGELSGLSASPGLGIAFDLPWPWGGERFEMRDIQPLTYITGPLGSGKTRLARRIAETLPGAVFLGLERLEKGPVALARLDADPVLMSRMDRTLVWLSEDEPRSQIR
jgi:DNA-binding transcriptional MerR regulator